MLIRLIAPDTAALLAGPPPTHSPDRRAAAAAAAARSYLQVYNEVISDLLKPERSGLKIREDKRKGLYVEGLSEWIVRTPSEILGLLEAGRAGRATGATRLNEASSRSHAVFLLIVEQSETVRRNAMHRCLPSPSPIGESLLKHVAQASFFAAFYRSSAVFFRCLPECLVPPQLATTASAGHELAANAAAGSPQQDAARAAGRQARRFVVGKLNLVDLAGSERVRLSGAAGEVQECTRPRAGWSDPSQ